MKQERGIAAIFIILVLVLAVGAGIYWYFMIYLPNLESLSTPTVTETKLIKKTSKMEDEKSVEFETMVETENTPAEIDNETVEELDELINSIEGEEDLSDL